MECEETGTGRRGLPQAEGQERNGSRDAVILVHGLWMTGREMSVLGRRLTRAGFSVSYFRYSSWRGSLAEAASRLAKTIAGLDRPTVHLVGHSLGGIVIARMLETDCPRQVCRIVFLGSPIQAGAFAASLAKVKSGRLILGPVACEGIVEKRPVVAPGREILSIAGTLPVGFGSLFGVAAPHDGTIAAEETVVPGAQSLHIRASHMGLLISPAVARNVIAFLATGDIADGSPPVTSEPYQNGRQ